uniref:Uncharacterized protein n=1 Tax=Aegilops tauschii subsp. strangulata TaxID=200361 RepID=A0A453IT90_AEGTS
MQCTTPSSGRLMHTSMPMGARDGVDWSLERTCSSINMPIPYLHHPVW